MSDDDRETKAHCPECGEQLIYVTSVPHPQSPTNGAPPQ